MTRLPSDPESKIGKPQVLARCIDLDGMQVLVRLQKPFEEPLEDTDPPSRVEIINGKPTLVPPVPETDPEAHIIFGTALIVEAWSEATKSVVTTGIKKPEDKTEEQFQFGVRYMLNHSSDAEIAAVLRIKGIHKQLKFQCGLDDTAVILPKPPKQIEKKKPT